LIFAQQIRTFESIWCALDEEQDTPAFEHIGRAGDTFYTIDDGAGIGIAGLLEGFILGVAIVAITRSRRPDR